MKYEGHLPDGSSVQRHSAGPLYPYVIAAHQKGESLEWGFVGPDTGGFTWIGTWDEAHNAAEFCKARYDRRQAAAQKPAEVVKVGLRATMDRILAHNQREWNRFALQRG